MGDTAEDELVVYTLAEVEDRFGIKARTMKSIHKQGNVSLVKIGNKYHITKEELRSFVKANTLVGAGGSNDT
jgi:hypothetical protein